MIRRKVEAVFNTQEPNSRPRKQRWKDKSDVDAASRKVQVTLEKNPEYKAQIAKHDKSQAVLDSSSKPVVRYRRVHKAQ